MAYGNGSLPSGQGGIPTRMGGRNRRNKSAVATINRDIGYSATVNTLLLDISKTASEQEGAVKTGDISEVRVQNTGDVGTWAMFRYAFWSAAATDGGADYLVHHFLLPNDEIRLPAIRAINFQTLSSVSASVAAGKIIVATFEESNSAGANAQANMTVKYQLT